MGGESSSSFDPWNIIIMHEHIFYYWLFCHRNGTGGHTIGSLLNIKWKFVSWTTQMCQKVSTKIDIGLSCRSSMCAKQINTGKIVTKRTGAYPKKTLYSHICHADWHRASRNIATDTFCPTQWMEWKMCTCWRLTCRDTARRVSFAGTNQLKSCIKNAECIRINSN